MEYCEGGRVSEKITPFTRRRVMQNAAKIHLALLSFAWAFTGDEDPLRATEIARSSVWFELLSTCPKPFENALDTIYGVKTGKVCAHQMTVVENEASGRHIEVTQTAFWPTHE